jgi:hypothetical protein
LAQYVTLTQATFCALDTSCQRERIVDAAPTAGVVCVAIAVEIASIVTPLNHAMISLAMTNPIDKQNAPPDPWSRKPLETAMIQVKPKRVRISPDDDSVGKKRSRDERNAAVADDECFDNVQKSV